MQRYLDRQVLITVLIKKTSGFLVPIYNNSLEVSCYCPQKIVQKEQEKNPKCDVKHAGVKIPKWGSTFLNTLIHTLTSLNFLD